LYLASFFNTPSYQLALTIPGISPFNANSLNLLRAMPNLRNVPRGRPVRAQRLRFLVGEEFLGNCYFITNVARFFSLSTKANLVMTYILI